jgi:hypothetical protein
MGPRKLVNGLGQHLLSIQQHTGENIMADAMVTVKLTTAEFDRVMDALVAQRKQLSDAYVNMPPSKARAEIAAKNTLLADLIQGLKGR